MLIRDLEVKSGLERATIRFYEKEGLLLPQRKENGYREYSREDLNTLLKIKLLRQLGLPLETIKQLQKGNADFSEALQKQIGTLEHQIRINCRAKDVCNKIHRSGVDYCQLDAEYYLNELTRPYEQTPTWQPKPVPEFAIEKSFHPVRRLMARLIDIEWITVVLLILFQLVLRFRPLSSGIWRVLIQYGSYFLAIPFCAFCLHKWGTTPGKWVMGIQIESENGVNLTFSEAIDREWWLLHRGLGLGIPFWQYIRLWRSYQHYSDFGELEWDRAVEIHCDDWKPVQKAGIAATVFLCAFITILSVNDSLMPGFRGQELSISQFSKNYNEILDIYYGDEGPKELKDDGTWVPDPEGTITVSIFGQAEEPNKPLSYETEGECIRAISYENRYEDVFMVTALDHRCKNVALTLISSQRGIRLSQILEFAKMLDEAGQSASGTMEYGNLMIQWDSKAENCELLQGVYYTADDSQESGLTIWWKISVLD